MNNASDLFIEIAVLSLTVSSSTSLQPGTTIICELYFGEDSYLRLLCTPTLHKNRADFETENIIRVPYSQQTALAFKYIRAKDSKGKNSISQKFLGHALIDTQSCKQATKNLKDLTGKRIKTPLEEVDAQVEYEVSIINKTIIEEDFQNNGEEIVQVNLFEEENNSQLSYDVPQIKQNISMTSEELNHLTSVHKYRHALSQLNSPLKIPQPPEHPPALSPDKLAQLLYNLDDIIFKHEYFNKRLQILGKYWRNNKGRIRSAKIQQMEMKKKDVIRQVSFNIALRYCCVAAIAFLVGMFLV